MITKLRYWKHSTHYFNLHLHLACIPKKGMLIALYWTIKIEGQQATPWETAEDLHIFSNALIYSSTDYAGRKAFRNSKLQYTLSWSNNSKLEKTMHQNKIICGIRQTRRNSGSWPCSPEWQLSLSSFIEKPTYCFGYGDTNLNTRSFWP